jgi:hypothetical protein
MSRAISASATFRTRRRRRRRLIACKVEAGSIPSLAARLRRRAPLRECPACLSYFRVATLSYRFLYRKVDNAVCSSCARRSIITPIPTPRTIMPSCKQQTPNLDNRIFQGHFCLCCGTTCIFILAFKAVAWPHLLKRHLSSCFLTHCCTLQTATAWQSVPLNMPFDLGAQVAWEASPVHVLFKSEKPGPKQVLVEPKA